MGFVLNAALGVVAAVLLYLLARPRRGQNEPPLVGGHVPWLGAMVDFAMRPLGSVRAAWARHGECFTLYVIGRKMTFMMGPEAHAVFFGAKDAELSSREAYQMMVPVFGRGVVYDTTTENMYKQLKLIKAGLKPQSLRAAVPLMNGVLGKVFTRYWGESGEHRNVLEDLNRVTMLTATKCLFGEEIHRMMWDAATTFTRHYASLEHGINPLALFYPNLERYLPLPAFKRRDAARVEIVRMFSAIIDARRAARAAEPSATPPDDVLQVFIDACDSGDGVLPDNDAIVGMLIALLFAGQHTSSITSTWTLLHLVHNPRVRDEVIAEARRVLAAHNNALDFDALRDMTLLDQCVRETLRMSPPLIHLMRVVKKPIRYKNFVVPPGHLICCSPGVAMRGAPWKDGDTWNPHRFDNEREQPSPKFAYIPFGGGRHGCPGQVFGIQQVKTIIATLLLQYEFDACGAPMPPHDYTALVVGPTAPVRMRYRLRKDPLHPIGAGAAAS